MLEVVGRQATLTGIVIEVADLGAHIQCFDGMIAQRTKTHCTDIQAGSIIGLAALLCPDLYPCSLWRIWIGVDRVAKRFVLFGIDIEFGAKGVRVLLLFRACVDQGSRDPVIRPAFQRPLDNVAAQEGTKILEQPTKAGGERIIASQ
jgi:hypothetical protein